MHDRGALLCSACSGIFLLAETGLFDGQDATVHFAYARAFARHLPGVPIHPERVLVISGRREELVSSGASMSWHDLVLYLIARYAGRHGRAGGGALFALQWHQDGLTPYIVFEGKRDHGDGDVQGAQQWLDSHFAVANPVEALLERSRLAERTFKRRFTRRPASPIAYVQRLRVEDAKRRLERTEAPIDEISWRVGYEDAGLLPAPVQAHHRPGAGRLPQALPHPRLRPPVGPSRESLSVPRKRPDEHAGGRGNCHEPRQESDLHDPSRLYRQQRHRSRRVLFYDSGPGRARHPRARGS